MPPSQQNDSPRSTVTGLLEDLRGGNRDAFDDLFPLVYDELRRVAHAQRVRLKGHGTLNTTALVHEAFLKLSAPDEPDWESRPHLLSVAARAMRQILIDHARAKSAQKRGGDRTRVTLNHWDLQSPGLDVSGDHSDTLIALDESLGRLAEVNDRQHRIVECRFFGGMTIADTAAALGLSHATVERGWAVARAWLYREMSLSPQGPAAP